MRRTHTPGLIEVLRSTLEDVEQKSGLSADDESLQELKLIFDRRVADLQRAMASEFSAAASASDSEDSDWEMAS
ncbi:hypothetical protein [Occallatibacter savannae]|uniref:hypothetical protein n=1 Tax=Occallatibacter savannae TaxID=1002691 RepID=UPI000D6938C8|nr:hypothetical protein [Occallatibacter savannae]